MLALPFRTPHAGALAFIASVSLCCRTHARHANAAQREPGGVWWVRTGRRGQSAIIFIWTGTRLSRISSASSSALASSYSQPASQFGPAEAHALLGQRHEHVDQPIAPGAAGTGWSLPVCHAVRPQRAWGGEAWPSDSYPARPLTAGVHPVDARGYPLQPRSRTICERDCRSALTTSVDAPRTSGSGGTAVGSRGS